MENGWIAQLNRVLKEYQDEVQKLQKGKRMFDGVMGLGNHPGNAPCHEIMDRQVEALCGQATDAVETEGISELILRIFQAQGEWQGPEYARLMLAAIQRHTLPLISRLPAEEKEMLRRWYEQAYPRRKRLPVQDQILAALKQA
ncbi:MAG: hypothetical protein IJ188_10220 [Clostridia bacterium]|nr:hypothetical protein [Clostridia bacterium]